MGQPLGKKARVRMLGEAHSGAEASQAPGTSPTLPQPTYQGCGCSQKVFCEGTEGQLEAKKRGLRRKQTCNTLIQDFETPDL